MGDKTGIEWTDATWNPVTGCTKVSQGCKHCYAERVFPRAYAGQMVDDRATRDYPAFGEIKGDVIGRRSRRFTDVLTHADRLEMPLRWKRPRRIFVNSMSDLFHEDVPDDFIDRVFAVMGLAQRHTFQVLTKRPERMRDYATGLTFDRIVGACNQTALGEPHGTDGASNLVSLDARSMKGRFVDGEKSAFRGVPRPPLPNVWLGVSCEDQATANERIPLLMETPAAVRWISAEPLLGPVDVGNWMAPLHDFLSPALLDWVVVGGESGPGARPMHPDWARSLLDQCAAARVPFLFKQWGEYEPVDFDTMRRVGKRAAGRVLDGKLWDEYPQVKLT